MTRAHLPFVPLSLGALAVLTGCATPPSGPLTLVSTPSDARVTLSDGRTCQTPCAVELAASLTATIAKAGYRATSVTLEPGTRGEVPVTLEPAGRAVGVEEVELDLEPAG